VHRSHHYTLALTWTGNRGSGTSGYRDYGREHEVSGTAPTILGSSDPSFLGDPERWNPEQLLLASLAQCHLLWYLHLASAAGVVVTGYVDQPTGTIVEDNVGAGQFTEVTLNPVVTVADSSQIETANALHERVGDYCFIARSVKFPVHHNPTATT
jgi:organic hydroperoxide reductase OsmC/OhrA